MASFASAQHMTRLMTLFQWLHLKSQPTSVKATVLKVQFQRLHLISRSTGPARRMKRSYPVIAPSRELVLEKKLTCINILNLVDKFYLFLYNKHIKNSGRDLQWNFNKF